MGMGLASSGRRARGSKRAPMAEINVTPFVDVMLVLLIICMVTAPLLASGVPVDLPESRANPIDQTPEQVTVSIDNTGVIFVEDAAVPDGELAATLAQIEPRADGQPPIVVLRGDQALQYARVMAVMGELNRAGFNQITLVTDGSSASP
ncbi:ExbD/TolR family protein [Altererythrobacter lutimaris]|uniref:Biopolymer transporter ExbD n=1 Tax=Altererythrobacter lutimaris TaxID=2743979 RepID=A0A850HE68_9SPHN|nr:biopolymer transporter ExbD [Altererythrobacter lutimaris]NVE95970.1 biopolymer transporter ExbD [Altererythrobacter lutimaris]